MSNGCVKKPQAGRLRQQGAQLRSEFIENDMTQMEIDINIEQRSNSGHP